MFNATYNAYTMGRRQSVCKGYAMTIKTTWRFPKPKLTTSQKHAIAIKALIDTNPIALSTANICDKLAISRGQFQAAKPYFRDYRSIGCYWYTPDSAESAKKKYEEEKRLLAIKYNAFHNGKRRKAVNK